MTEGENGRVGEGVGRGGKGVGRGERTRDEEMVTRGRELVRGGVGSQNIHAGINTTHVNNNQQQKADSCKQQNKRTTQHLQTKLRP